MTLFHFIFVIVGLRNMLIFWFIIPFKAPVFCFGSMMPTPFSVTNMFKRSHSVDICYNTLNLSFYTCHTWSSSISTSFCLKSWYPFRVIDRGYIKAFSWWVTSYWHQFIIQEVDLETPFGTLVLANINDKFPHSRRQVFVIGLRPTNFVWCSTSTHSFTHTDCTVVPWDPLTSSLVFLAFVNNLHNWPAIRWCLACSTSDRWFT